MNISRIISGIAHPILMPLYSVFVIFHANTYLDYTPYQLIRIVYIIVAISTIILPLSILPVLKLQKVVSDYGLEQRNERIIPLIFAITFYLLGYYLLRKIPFVFVVSSLQLAATISILLIALISVKWKISIHMAAIGGLVGLLLVFGWIFNADCRIYFMVATLFSGLLAAARLKLNLHTPKQIYVGFFTGFVTIFTTMTIALLTN